MKKAEWKLRERALTLYSTGKFESRLAAMKEAIAEQKREDAKRAKDTADANWVPFQEDGD